MDTVLTLLIWLGSGFTFALGILVGAKVFKGSSKTFDKFQQASLAALQRRNEIGERQAEALERIVYLTETRTREINDNDYDD